MEPGNSCTAIKLSRLNVMASPKGRDGIDWTDRTDKTKARRPLVVLAAFSLRFTNVSRSFFEHV